MLSSGGGLDLSSRDKAGGNSGAGAARPSQPGGGVSLLSPPPPPPRFNLLRARGEIYLCPE